MRRKLNYCGGVFVVVEWVFDGLTEWCDSDKKVE